MIRYFAAVLAAPLLLHADAISVGIRAGVPLSDAFTTETRNAISTRSIPNRYTFGPAFEVRLPASLGVTFDILYRRLTYEQQTGTSAPIEKSGGQWDFPLMLRYRFGQGNVRPFAAGGLNFTRISSSLVTDPANFVRKTTNGIVLGAGVELKLPLIRIAPELRYTHRANDSFRDSVNSLIRANANQVDFLVGITF